MRENASGIGFKGSLETRAGINPYVPHGNNAIYRFYLTMKYHSRTTGYHLACLRDTRWVDLDLAVHTYMSNFKCRQTLYMFIHIYAGCFRTPDL